MKPKFKKKFNLRKQRMRKIQSGDRDRDGNGSWCSEEIQERPRKRAKFDSEIRKRTRRKSVVVDEAPVKKKVRYEGVRESEQRPLDSESSRSKYEVGYSGCTKEKVSGVKVPKAKAVKVTQLSRIFEENQVENVKKPLGISLSASHSARIQKVCEDVKPPLEKSVSVMKKSTSSPMTKRNGVNYPVKTKNTPKMKKYEIDRRKHVKTLKDYFECKTNGQGIEESCAKIDTKNEYFSPAPSNVTPMFPKQPKKTSPKKKSVVKLNAKNTTKPILKYFSRISAPGNSPEVKSSRTGADKLVGEDKSCGRTGSLD